MWQLGKYDFPNSHLLVAHILFYITSVRWLCSSTQLGIRHAALHRLMMHYFALDFFFKFKIDGHQCFTTALHTENVKFQDL